VRLDVTPDFTALFGRSPAARADAPGRVNLIGEHTDYNGGFVLPSALPQRTVVELARRSDDTVRVASADVAGGAAPVEYRLGAEAPGRDWLDYVQGITAVLRADGCSLGGFECRIASRIPVGSGLASSAALEVALLRALRTAFDLALDDVALALAAQRAESDFVGARVGIMDQMAASLADERSALFLDTRSRAWERIPLPAGAALVVIDSGVAHRNVGGEYNARRAECERAATLLRVPALRDVASTRLDEVAALPEPLGRRARHVVTENARVLDAVAALRAGDVGRLGALLDASHASLRDDFAVSTPEVDLLAALARARPEVHGARLTGGGFGGAVVALARPADAAAVAGAIAREYEAQSGRRAAVLVPA
jgi:galactokinase